MKYAAKTRRGEIFKNIEFNWIVVREIMMKNAITFFRTKQRNLI